jgi:hypothetical protein
VVRGANPIVAVALAVSAACSSSPAQNAACGLVRPADVVTVLGGAPSQLDPVTPESGGPRGVRGCSFDVSGPTRVSVIVWYLRDDGTKFYDEQTAGLAGRSTFGGAGLIGVGGLNGESEYVDILKHGRYVNVLLHPLTAVALPADAARQLGLSLVARLP